MQKVEHFRRRFEVGDFGVIARTLAVIEYFGNNIGEGGGAVSAFPARVGRTAPRKRAIVRYLCRVSPPVG
jgi:hypothetical protein